MTDIVNGGPSRTPPTTADAPGDRATAKRGITVERIYTTPGVHPYDEVTWERRDVVMTNWRDGSINFEQRGVEFPDFWSVNATNIVTSKYFRGAVGSPERESSLRQLIDRVVSVYTRTGLEQGYFATAEDAEIFNHELTWALLHQVFSFNSPVWFNVGTASPQQVSACLPHDALVSTPSGLVRIGELVAADAVGTKVYDAHGVTSVVATKNNGVREVLRITLTSGHQLDVTADHLVWRASGHPGWVEAGTLRPGDALSWHRTDSYGESELDVRAISEAALAGWLQSAGFVGQDPAGTNRSLTAEFMTVTPDELQWVTAHLERVFPDAHRHERRVATQDTTLDCRRTRLDGEYLADFVERWGLRARGVDMEVPQHLYTAPLPVVAAYVRSVFQAEGYVSHQSRPTLVALDMISEKLVRGLQDLLGRFGIFGDVGRKADPRANRHDCWTLRIQNRGDRELFATLVGFIDRGKAERLEATLDQDGPSAGPTKRLEIASVDRLGAQDVFDIQTESGEFLAAGLRVHNCFILAVDDTMDSILNWYKEEGRIFKGGSGAGLNLSRIRSSKELLSSGGTASGPVSFMRGADASAGTIKSGGATRRAAKMVVLDVDHPDIEEFVETKAREEDKIRVLRDAGFDMDLGGKDITSVQYQNANNSVRVSDEFMHAVENGDPFGLRARATGEVIETLDARELFTKIATAAWECADPGIQYDSTINDWHTTPESGRITASNPCFPGDQRVVTDKGLIRIADLVGRAALGESFRVYTNDATAAEAQEGVTPTQPVQYMVTGTNEILELRFSDGSRLRCTPGHRLWTTNRGWVHARDLTDDDHVLRSFEPAPRTMATLALPEAATNIARDARMLALPEKWDAELAHYLGWLVGDGHVAGTTATTVYGSADDIEHILPRHRAVLAEWTGLEAKPSEQPNGTVQLRTAKRTMIDFFHALGIRDVPSHDKTVPESLFEAPDDAVAAFLRGLFDADGYVVDHEVKGARYVGLGSTSEELLVGVQELLAAFGIAARIHTTSPTAASTDSTHVADESATVMHDLRISGRAIRVFADRVGFGVPHKQAQLDHVVIMHKTYAVDETVRLVARTSRGYETTYNLTEPRNHSYIVGGTVVANCSEYMHLDNSSCNLASLNLLKFLRDDNTFDADAFAKVVELVITAMDISICFADFPTEAIGETTRAFRQLGIGYANLGALLMATGHGYDSEGGRAICAAITSLMTGTAYKRSAELAGVVGPYDGYARNADAHKRVMRKHAAANDDVRAVDGMSQHILAAATRAWADCLEVGNGQGWRNAQASVLAPTGTIGLMMDCDTTGIEPDLALVKFKKLVGGGSMQIVNQTVPRALRTLGYQDEQVEAIVEYVAEHGTVVDAPGIRPEHYEVFDCAMGARSIKPMGHVKMMAAAQPFLSGAISKCVVGDTLLTTEDGLVRIGSLYEGEDEDTFREMALRVASLGGERKTDAFYYGGRRPVRTVRLRSGHTITGTYVHRVLVAAQGGLAWKTLAEIEPGDYVATQLGADLWSAVPASMRDITVAAAYGAQKRVTLPQEMTSELAFLLGAYASEGHTTVSNWTVHITNADEGVLQRVAAAWQSEFGLTARIVRPADRCSSVIVASKTVVEFLAALGCGTHAANKRIPNAVLRSPRSMVLAFLSGLALDAYVTFGGQGKWAICVDSPGLLDDLQAIMTNLGVSHGRISKYNPAYDKSYDEVYASGEWGQLMAELVPFAEASKAAQAAEFRARTYRSGTSDIVPGITGRELYALIPRAAGRSGADRWRSRFTFLLDHRTTHVTRRTIERLAAIPGIVLPDWLQQVLTDNLHFAPVADVDDAPDADVYDVSVPGPHAFVANGIVNHNTVNMPESATVDEIEEIYLQGWKLGLKALAIYRDNCKVGQPLSDAKAKPAAATETVAPAELRPVRKRLPKARPSVTTSFTVGGAEGYMTAGSYPDDGLGEVFLKLGKQGSTLAGVMDSFSIAISIALQYGVPLETFVEKFTNLRFEPAGMTDDPDIRMAQSVIDYIFRRLALDYLPYDTRAALGIHTAAERARELETGSYLDESDDDDEELDTETLAQSAAVTKRAAEATGDASDRGDLAEKRAPIDVHSSTELLESQLGKAADAPLCMTCGTKMRPAGSCYVCEGCGSTSGCS